MAATVIMAVKHRPPLLPILLFLILVVGCSKYYKRRDLLTLLPFDFYLILERGAQNFELLFSIPIGGRGQNIMIAA